MSAAPASRPVPEPVRTVPTRPRFGTHARVVALLLALAVLVGVGTGSVLALWQDAEHVSGRVPLGVVVFGAGAPGALEYATGTTQRPDGRGTGRVTFPFGPEQAATLYNDNDDDGGAIAIPLQVDSLAQGNRGLRYELDLDVDGGVFGASQLETYKVMNETVCTPDLVAEETHEHTPWTSDYSATTTPQSDSWCVIARYWPTRWQHENTATVTAPSPVGGADVTDSDTWSAEAEITHDPADEPAHSIDVDFQTFGSTP